MPTPTRSKPRRLFRDRERRPAVLAHPATALAVPVAISPPAIAAAPPAPAPRVEALNVCASGMILSGRYREAVPLLEQALEIDPGSIDVRFNLATARFHHPRSAADIESALLLAREVLAEQPHNPNAHLLFAIACYHAGIDEYRAHLDTALARIPVGHGSHSSARCLDAVSRLEIGEFSAWPDLDRVYWEGPAARLGFHLGNPPWEGDALHGRRILLNSTTEGSGNAFQYIRFVPLLKAMGGDVSLLCRPAEARLLRRLIAQAADAPPRAFGHDIHVPLMGLPAILRTTPETIPSEVPYLAADDDTIERWRPTVEAIPGEVRVGVAWQGNPQYGYDALRSFPLAELAPLAEVPGVTLVSLQKGHGVSQLADAPFPIHDLGQDYQSGDWMDTAGVMRHLDLVVTPDTGLGHLGGALARPVWMALSRPAECRWMRDRDDSPWYPTMRLFRQAKLGEWGPVFRRMAEALGGIVAGR